MHNSYHISQQVSLSTRGVSAVSVHSVCGKGAMADWRSSGRKDVSEFVQKIEQNTSNFRPNKPKPSLMFPLGSGTHNTSKLLPPYHLLPRYLGTLPWRARASGSLLTCSMKSATPQDMTNYDWTNEPPDKHNLSPAHRRPPMQIYPTRP